ncbi:MAG: DUF3332 domain-containing protein [Bacteroidales bacterium]|nr:DUF3332 domain-containing protein [Bacteroidales bacterium]
MKKFTTLAIACALLASMSMQSCIGSFALFNKLKAWNERIDSKFVNELVFIGFWIIPVYEVSFLADILVLNSIEFWSGSSPVAKGKSIIDGADGKYLVECDGKGYTITSMNDGSKTRLNFHQDIETWTIVMGDDEELPFLTFVDETHVRVPGLDGKMQLVELSNDGLYAYKASMLNLDLACK